LIRSINSNKPIEKGDSS